MTLFNSRVGKKLFLFGFWSLLLGKASYVGVRDGMGKGSAVLVGTEQAMRTLHIAVAAFLPSSIVWERKLGSVHDPSLPWTGLKR